MRHVVDILKKVAPGTLWRDEQAPSFQRWRWPKLQPGTIVPNITVQEAQIIALSGSAAVSATALAPLVLPRSLAQADPEDQKELAKLLFSATARNTGSLTCQAPSP